MKAYLLVALFLTLALACASSHAPISPRGPRSTAMRSSPGAKRALVIGIRAYGGKWPQLPNAIADAHDIGERLKALGFTVSERSDLTLDDLTEAIHAFNNSLSDDDVAVFYYSGHGAQVRGTNYLIPAHFNGILESQIKNETYHLQELIDQLEARKGVSIAFLDACRSGDNIVRDLTKGPKLIGLAAPELAEGLLVEYATSGGHVAYDGDGHGIFTSALLRHLGTPNEAVETTMKQVAKDVRDQTRDREDGEQVPYAYGRILDDFCFSGEACGASETQKLGIAHWREQHRPTDASLYVTVKVRLPASDHLGSMRAWIDRLENAFRSSPHGSASNALPREKLGPFADGTYHAGREYLRLTATPSLNADLQPSGEAESVPRDLLFHSRFAVFASREQSVHLLGESITSEPAFTTCTVYFSDSHSGVAEEIEATMEGVASFNPIAGQFEDWLDLYGAMLIIRDMDLYNTSDEVKQGFSFDAFMLRVHNGSWWSSLDLFPNSTNELYTDNQMSLIVKQADWKTLGEVPADYPGPRRAEFGPLPTLQ